MDRDLFTVPCRATCSIISLRDLVLLHIHFPSTTSILDLIR